MSIALYRKYRPATFGEVRGQEHVTDPLRQALRSGRINHAYLFSGPRGCGKTTSARILARSLNCVEGPTPDPCGACESCVALAPDGGGSIDVMEIDAASHGGVDDARDLRERAFFAPVGSRYKIYIIDEAHMVTREGFNALLKLVEEPPPHLKFVFATTEPEKVIGTIRSRTHHYPFRLIPPSTLKALFEDLLRQEGIPYDPAALPLVVRAGAGSARDGLSVLDQLIAGSGEEGITREGAVSLLGYTDSHLLAEMVDALGARDGAAVFGLIDRVVEGGHDPRRFTADLLERFRDLVVLAAVPDALDKGLVNVAPEAAERMRDQASRLGPAELTRAAEILNQGLTEMRGATAPRLLLELMCSRVLLPAVSGDDAAALVARLEQVERRPAASAPPAPQPTAPPASGAAASAPTAPSAGPSRPPSEPVSPAPARQSPPRPQTRSSEPDGWAAPRQAPAAPEAPAPSSGGGVDLNTLRGAWEQVLEAVKGRRRFTWMVLTGSNAHPVGVEGNTVLLAFNRPNDAKGFTNSGGDQLVADAVRQVLGIEVRVAAAGTNPGGAPTRRPAPAEPAGWDPPAQRPSAPSRPEPAPAGPPPGKVVPGLQAPPPDPFEDPSAAPPPEHVDSPEPTRKPESAMPEPAPAAPSVGASPSGTGTRGTSAVPSAGGASLIESELGGRVIEEIEHEAPAE
ncbi:DNA polymerase III subunit gamma and tau [Nocardiopsis sp. CNT312]|uniref:DNA polymerase III subunit gamma and tau n=1 Tax=Nocardiopsis sp. CNT312 TaxID=1137268 RepID=UPI00048BE615|nr:DNA polymerase III subunit gamma and tau [Nocardiopsis sp. CNT312]